MALTLAGSGGMDDEARAVAQAAHDLAVAADQRAARAMTRANGAETTSAAAHELATKAEADTVTLAELAAQLGAAIPASEQTHAAINKRIDDIQLTPGPAGPVGPQGLRGPSGVDGVQGAAGAAGAKGATGSTGSTGLQGVAGATGPSGTANLALGAAPVGLVGLGGSTTVTVSLSHAMPDTTYRVEIAHSAVVSLANVTLAVTAKTTTNVTVKVTSVGLAVAAGTLLVVAV